MSFACTSPCIIVISYPFVYLNEVVFNAILTLKEALGTMLDSPMEIRQATLFFFLDVQRISCVEIECFSAAIFVRILILRLHSNEYLPKVDKEGLCRFILGCLCLWCTLRVRNRISLYKYSFHCLRIPLW